MKADLLLKELSLLRGLFPSVVPDAPSPPQIVLDADAFLSESSQ